MSEQQPKPAGNKHVSKNFWVGFFTIMGVLVLVTITVSLRSWDFFNRRVTYYVVFKDVSGLDFGAKVFRAGVQIGEVSELEAVDIGTNRVKVKIRVDGEYKLYANARALISSAAVIGDTKINLDTGNGGNPLEPGSTIQGAEQPDMQHIALSVSQSIDSVTSLLQDPKNREAVQRTLTNLASVTEKMNSTFEMINNEMRPMVVDLHKTADNLNKFIDKAHAIAGELQGDMAGTRKDVQATAAAWTQAAKTLAAQVDATAKSVQQMADQLDGAISENRTPLKEVLGQLNQTGKALHDVAEELRGGEGTLGKLMSDPRLFNNLNHLIEQLARTVGGGRDPAFMTESPRRRGETMPEPRSGTISPIEPKPSGAGSGAGR